nr:cytochrome c oxidase subunit 2 [Meteorus sp. 2 XHS-2023a]
MVTWLMMDFQDFNSLSMKFMMNFHDFMMYILLTILFLIFVLFTLFLKNNYINLKILHNHLIEIIWTLLPIIILIFIAVPSLKLLYIVEEIMSPHFTVKILGHQWYWSYEFSDFFSMSFDSFMSEVKSVKSFRLLDVDNRLILPYFLKIRGIVSSVDVIHSWAMPSLGVKVDATPGRLNQFMMILERPGLFFGQCSEICGLNHSFMPIVIESISMKNFFFWMKSMYFK